MHLLSVGYFPKYNVSHIYYQVKIQLENHANTILEEKSV